MQKSLPQGALCAVTLSLQPLPSLRSVQWPPSARLQSLTGEKINIFTAKRHLLRKCIFVVTQNSMLR